jgi:molybdate/tungstate transport system permease protein
MFQTKTFTILSILISLFVLLFILLPIIVMIFTVNHERLSEAARDSEVMDSIYLSISASGTASLIVLIVGTPFSYFLSRKNFFGKSIVESVVDLPIMIPHTVVGISIISVIGKNFWLGKLLYNAGFRFLGTFWGIVLVMAYMGLPFYVNTVKVALDKIPVRYEKISQTLGANRFQTFINVIFPLSKKSMITGFILAAARGISEFGAVVIIAYYPMTAPVMIYQRFTSFGLDYAKPIAVILLLISLMIFFALRFIVRNKDVEA